MNDARKPFASMTGGGPAGSAPFRVHSEKNVAATLPATHYPDTKKMDRSDPMGGPPAVRRASPWADTLFSFLAHSAAVLTLALLAGIIISLLIGAAPAIQEYGLSFLWRSEWCTVHVADHTPVT